MDWIEVLHIIALSMITVGAIGMIFFRWRAHQLRMEIMRRKLAGTWTGKN
jgi:hypothetical protein